MTLKIININTQKEQYIFGEDKNIELNFELHAKDKDYGIESIYIEGGVQICLHGKKKDKYTQKFLVVGGVSIYNGSHKNFSMNIPIAYPNILKNHKNNSPLEIKNYLKIIVICNNEHQKIFQEFYPQISLEKKVNNGRDINLFNIDIHELHEDMKTLSKRLCEIEKHRNEQNLTYNNTGITKNISNDIFNVTAPVSTENTIDREDKILINKGFFGFNKDYVNRDFYQYVCKNFLLFNIREKLRNNLFIKPTYIITFIVLLFLLLFNKKLQIIEYKTFDLWIIFVGLIIISLPYFFLFQKGINLVKTKIINIIPNHKNILKSMIVNKNMDLKSIFKKLDIDYADNFECEFDVYLTCYLVAERDRNIYNTEIYMIQLGHYEGKRFNPNQIKDYTKNGILNNMYIRPGEINKRSILKAMPIYARIEYSIDYSFKSQDLINEYQIIHF